MHDLNFEPGFSTADKITDISGRGVWMDVVKKSRRDARSNGIKARNFLKERQNFEHVKVR